MASGRGDPQDHELLREEEALIAEWARVQKLGQPEPKQMVSL